MQDLVKAVEAMKNHSLKNSVNKIGLPRLGSGLDRLEWRVVKAAIEKTFEHSQVEILAFHLPPPTIKRSSLVIGDSQLRHAATEIRIGGVGTAVFPGIRMGEISKRLHYLKMQGERFNSIVIHAGTNNVIQAKSPWDIANDLKAVIEEGKTLFPSAYWAVSGVLHRRDVQDRFIQAVNQCTESACQEQGWRYVDPNCWIQDKDLAVDGLHLNRAGSRKLGMLLTKVANSLKNQGN